MSKFCLVAHVIKYLDAFHELCSKVLDGNFGVIAEKLFPVYIYFGDFFSLCCDCSILICFHAR